MAVVENPQCDKTFLFSTYLFYFYFQMFTNVHDVIIMYVVQFQIFLVYILCNFFRKFTHNS